MARRTSQPDALRGPAAAAAVLVLAALGAGCATATSSAAATTAPAAATATATPTSTSTPTPTPTDARRLFAEGLRLEGAGDLAAAAVAFEAAYDADPALAHAAVNAGGLHERLGEPDAARALYARVLDRSPDFGPA